MPKSPHNRYLSRLLEKFQYVPLTCAALQNLTPYLTCQLVENRERRINLAANTEFHCLVGQVFPFHFLYIFNTTDLEQTKAVLSLSCKNGIIDLLSNFNMY